jgi:xanthosine utilization system XapX-like protein
MDASPHQNATLLSPNTNLGLRVPTGSRTLHILLSIAQVAFLAGPRFPGRRAIASLTILGLLVGSQINPYFTDDLATAQPFSIEWATTLSVVEKILFAGPDGPEGSFWHIDKPVGEALAFSAFSFDKLKWALVLMVNMRGIRWNFQVKNVPPMKKTTRWNFVVTQCLNLVYFAFMADLFTQLGIRLFYTTPNGPPPDSKYLKLGHDDWRWSFLKAFVFGATPYYMLSMQYTMMSIPFVALHLSAPEVSRLHAAEMASLFSAVLCPSSAPQC